VLTSIPPTDDSLDKRFVSSVVDTKATNSSGIHLTALSVLCRPISLDETLNQTDRCHLIWHHRRCSASGFFGRRTQTHIYTSTSLSLSLAHAGSNQRRKGASEDIDFPALGRRNINNGRQQLLSYSGERINKK
jgi:hypothetical protein